MTKIYDLNGSAKGELKLPRVFTLPYRSDLVQRAVLALQSSRRQPYGADTLAGKRTSAHYHGVKGAHDSMKNKEIARMARSHGGPPGTEFRARTVPQARGGRAAHPPKTEKIWELKINNKERKVALLSAIAATARLDLIKLRHRVDNVELPLIVVDDIQKVSRTKELRKILNLLKLESDLERASVTKVRSGKGKMRGRRYKSKKSALIVVSSDKGVLKAARNIAGVDVCTLQGLNVELLAPGTHAGRLVVWDESSIKKLGELYG